MYICYLRKLCWDVLASLRFGRLGVELLI
jgi:hypothetical protein